MPITLEVRLVNCRDKFLRLYLENEHPLSLLQQLKDVDAYYNSSFNKSTYMAERIVQSYELFVDNLVKVKNRHLSADEALQKIQDTTFDRKLGIVFYNIAKVLEIAFWSAATTLFFLCATTATVPNPILGVGFTIVFAALMVKSISNLFHCIDDLKSCTRLNAENERERSLVSFFKPPIFSIIAEHSPATEQLSENGVMMLDYH
ncbi:MULTISPECIES: DUF5638 domain-containing protein [Legionella]|uniref:DUF5638 domain-containing protein n=1 Tax=Legionella resiliens TaxID=2905958 RepID=A0ABS8X246_9GAMM|nr:MULTISPECIES: DUF5638 domain-containing protein [unclassified Legionella]MCE0723666.1 DUF5638 domain-containing protein [Legionella sp. 9fVS26]MCE3532818.1 DUF5638 domain-containing protein [Legionella sp. 8cVS16]QLZ69002.1 hypothetical protein FOLKNPGA_01784 [Legionella sp. PC1000]